MLYYSTLLMLSFDNMILNMFLEEKKELEY